MYKNNFLKIACFSPKLEVGNPKYNVNEMINLVNNCKASIACFPELAITGVSVKDLFFQNQIISEAKNALLKFAKENKYNGLIIVGAPILVNNKLYNCAVVIKNNQIIGIVPKSNLDNEENRWFDIFNDENIYIDYDGLIPFGNIIFNCDDLSIGIELSNDLESPIAKSSKLSLSGANIIINIARSIDYLGYDVKRRNAVLDNSYRNSCAYAYVSSGINESSSDGIFSSTLIISELGEKLCESNNYDINSKVIYADIDINKINYVRRKNYIFRNCFDNNFNCIKIDFKLEESKLYDFENKIDITPFIPKNDIINQFDKARKILEYALVKRLMHINTKKIIIGISGGLDSTLAVLIAHQAYNILGWDPKGIIAVTMPGLGTSNRTKKNAIDLMEGLNLTILDININDSVLEHFKLINHDPNIKDLTYENTQARMRTMILMDLATKYNGFVLGTGDLSELALGWCTYNGDQMSMYGINSGIPKTMVRFMIDEYSKNIYSNIKDCLQDIIATPISPELQGSEQKTEDAIGKYEVNDYILYRFIGCGDNYERIVDLVSIAFDLGSDEAINYVNNFFRRFYSQQFKRQALPDGPKVLDISLSSRMDFKMPSDVKRG